MLLSALDVDVLRVLRWCQYALPSDMARFHDESMLPNILSMGFIKSHAASGTVLLTKKGHCFLDSNFTDILPSSFQSYRRDAIIRKLHLSRIMLSFYHAGYYTFLTQIRELTTSPSLFLPTINRGRGQNPWANTRIAAIVSFPDTLSGVHYVCRDIGKVLLNDELSALSRNTATLPEKPKALLFAGESYSDILSELNTGVPETNERLISYGEAYRKSPLPVHLLSCDDTGVTQLRIMAQPNYRQKLSQLALRGHFTPPPKGAAYNALYNGAPFLIAIDMDLRRIDALCHSQKENGGTLPAIAALDKQVEEVLRERYKNMARVFTITTETLSEFFGTTPPNPADQVFISPKGEPVHAPIIQTRRKN